MALDKTPIEIFLHIIRYLEVEDVIALRKTSKALEQVTHHRSVWFDILHDKVVGRAIPTPGTTDFTVASASAKELEEVCIRALTLRRNWARPRPQYVSQTSFLLRERSPTAFKPYDPNAPPSVEALTAALLSPDIKFTRCLALYFLPNRGNRYIIVILRIESGAFGNGQFPPAFEIQCWDIAGNPCRVAKYSCSNLLSACVNVESSHPACLIVTQRTQRQEQDAVSFALGINFASQAVAVQSNKDHGFEQHSSFSSFKSAVRLQGSLFFASDETNSVRIIDIDTGNVLYRLNAPSMQVDGPVHPDEFKCLNSLVIGSFVLMFRQQWVHLYDISGLGLTTLSSNSTDSPKHTGPIDLQRIAEYKWPWRIDTVDVMAKQKHALQDQFIQLDSLPSRTKPAPPIHILLRFASVFPWPINILHNYILPSNPEFDMRETGAEDPVRQDQLPYLPTDASGVIDGFKPYISSSISSHVRLFTPSDTAMGAYGTVLFMDAQDETSEVAQAADRGQRVAGRLMDVEPRPRDRAREAMPRYLIDLAGTGDDNPPPENEHLNTIAPDGNNPRPGMVFHVQEDKDDWARIAMCEEEGIIVLGSTGDQVYVYRYI